MLYADNTHCTVHGFQRHLIGSAGFDFHMKSLKGNADKIITNCKRCSYSWYFALEIKENRQVRNGVLDEAHMMYIL